MANTAATSPGTMANDSSAGTVAWTNPDNAKVEGGSSAIFGNNWTTGSNVYSNYLKATNFGFSIPSGATIDGIKAEIKEYEDGGGYAGTPSIDTRVSIIKADGTYGTTDKANDSGLPYDSLTYVTYGGTTDLWGETWSDTDINDSDFGVIYQGMVNEEGGGGACFIAGTKVHTPNGLVNIENIKIGNTLISFDEKTLKKTTSIVLNTHEIKKDKILTIKTKNNKVIVTDTQLFYIEGKILKASELKIGDVVSIYKNGNVITEKIKSIDIKKEETFVYDISITEPKLYSADNFIVHNVGFHQYIDHIRITIYYTEAGSSAIKSINGLAKASIKSRNSLAIGSIKSINGLS